MSSNEQKIEDNLKTVNTKPFDFKLPPKLKFLLIDIGQKHNPTFPPNEEYSFHVLVFEPILKIASSLSAISAGMTVLSCGVGSEFGINILSSKHTNDSSSVINYGLRSGTKPNLCIKIPLKEILSSVPPQTEIFFRADIFNFDLKDAQKTGKTLKRITLFKKIIKQKDNKNTVIKKKRQKLDKTQISTTNDSIETNQTDTETIQNDWVFFMKSIGFKLLKIDKVNTGLEIVWLNPNPLLGEPQKPSDTFLLQSELDQNMIKIKNYVKITFNALFIGYERVNIYKGSKNFELLKPNVASWQLVPPDTYKLPSNAFCVNKDIKIPTNEPKTTNSNTNSEEQTKKPSQSKMFLTHNYFKGGLHCGHTEETNLTESNFCWSKYQLFSGNYQVLCGNTFKWQPVSGQDIPHGSVVCGQENTGEELYAARVRKNTKIFIGKVCATWLIMEGTERRLKSQYYDNETIFTDNFEILVYTGEV